MTASTSRTAGRARLSTPATSADSASFGPIKLDKTRPTPDRVCRQARRGARPIRLWTWTNQNVRSPSTARTAAAASRPGHGSGRHGDRRRRADQSVTSLPGACTDEAGNSAADSVGFDYDETAPTASTTLDRGPDHNGWYNAAVAYTTTGTDATSGIASCTSGTYAGPDGSGLTVSGTCTDNAGNPSATTASAAFKYDNTDPAVTASVSPNPVVLNGAAIVTKSATDNLSGVVGSPLCGALDTSSVGPKSVTCTVSDSAGNLGSTIALYGVIFNFHGFFQPVDNSGVYNSVNSGRAIPVKFDLSGDQGLNIFAPGYPASTIVPCSGTAGTDELEETLTAGNSSLSYGEGQPYGQYNYVWKTDKSWANTCRRLT